MGGKIRWDGVGWEVNKTTFKGILGTTIMPVDPHTMVHAVLVSHRVSGSNLT